MRVRAMGGVLYLLLAFAAGCSSRTIEGHVPTRMLPDFSGVPRQTEPPLEDGDKDDGADAAPRLWQRSGQGSSSP